MRSTFEEKSFENYFNNELDRNSDIYFPPGQVQEGNLGFDSSAFSRNRRLWRRLGYPFWYFPHFEGADLTEIAGEMERLLGEELDDIPSMKANLLFQYKRPEYISIPLGSEWIHWNQPYYRYDIYPEQQSLLMHIHTHFGAKILILYASPAIHEVNDLVKIHLKRELIDYSNFRKVSELNNHHRNTYIAAGLHSIACSQPKKLESINLLKELEGLRRNTDSSENDTNRKFIKN